MPGSSRRIQNPPLGGRAVLILAIAILHLVAPLIVDVRADIRPGATPQEVAAALMDATRAGDFQTYAALLHSEAAQSLRNSLVHLAEADTSGEVSRVFFGGAPIEEIRKQSGQVVFANLMTGLTNSLPGFKQIMASMTTDTIGTLAEGDLIHVVNRVKMNVGGASTSKVEVLTLKRDGTEWRALLSAEIEEMVRRLTSGR